MAEIADEVGESRRGERHGLGLRGRGVRGPLGRPAKPGVVDYRYEVTETAPGQPPKTTRMDYGLSTSASGEIDLALKRAATSTDGKTWTEAKVTEACRAAMHGDARALARVKVWPATGDLGPGFLNYCAPDEVFFPLTDIVNVVLVEASPAFKAGELNHPGDHAHFQSFTAAFARNGMSMKETPRGGGETTLVSASPDRVVLDWAPAIADLEIQRPSPQGGTLDLAGTEHWAFRLAIDPRTRELVSASTPYDDLDLTVHIPGLPPDKAPRLKITRSVTIQRM